jgi:hypothetical protein
MGNVAAMSSVAVLGALILGWIAMYGYCSGFAVSARRQRFLTRELLSDDEWCDTHFPQLDRESRKHAIAISSVFARRIGVAPTQLLPTDRIHSDYCLMGMCRLFDDSWEEWSDEVGKYVVNIARGRVSDTDLEEGGQWRTLEDFVRGVLVLLKDKSN